MSGLVSFTLACQPNAEPLAERCPHGCHGTLVITKKCGDHEIFITKIFNHGIFSNFTKILNHENLELYGIYGALDDLYQKITCFQIFFFNIQYQITYGIPRQMYNTVEYCSNAMVTQPQCVHFAWLVSESLLLWLKGTGAQPGFQVRGCWSMRVKHVHAKS